MHVRTCSVTNALAGPCVSIPVVGFSVDLLKNVIVHQEKCTIRAPLTCQQWCVVLSALKDAKKLKEFCVQMKYTWVRAADMSSEVTIDTDVFPY